MTIEKQVSYTNTNTYHTLNKYTSKTKNVWLVFHGMGYLSRYFIQYFSQLDATENFIVAPQAPSKYYQGKNFKHVGASWLTRENTLLETENVLAYNRSNGRWPESEIVLTVNAHNLFEPQGIQGFQDGCCEGAGYGQGFEIYRHPGFFRCI